MISKTVKRSTAKVPKLWGTYWSDPDEGGKVEKFELSPIVVTQGWLDFANLIPGSAEVPEFRLAGTNETSADRESFAKFIDEHFPHGRKK